MFGPALSIFRETLEAALVITIIAAATRAVQRRSLCFVLRTLIGIVGSGVLERPQDRSEGYEVKWCPQRSEKLVSATNRLLSTTWFTS